MRTGIQVVNAMTAITAAALACTWFSGVAGAADRVIVDSIHVSTDGLDLTRTSDAQRLYMRLKDAAYVLCTRGTRAGLEPVKDYKGCYEKALGNAVRSVRAPLVTQMYLRSHTFEEAVAHGIGGSEQLAAK